MIRILSIFYVYNDFEYVPLDQFGFKGKQIKKFNPPGHLPELSQKLDENKIIYSRWATNGLISFAMCKGTTFGNT